MIKFIFNTWASNPQKIEVEKETEKFVYRVGEKTRTAKTTDYECIRDTEDECYQWLINIQQKKANLLAGELDYVNKKIANLKSKLSK